MGGCNSRPHRDEYCDPTTDETVPVGPRQRRISRDRPMSARLQQQLAGGGTGSVAGFLPPGWTLEEMTPVPLGSPPIVALVPASVRTSHCHNKSEGVGAEVECDLDQGGGQGNDSGHSCSGSSSSSDVSNDTWETAELAGEEQSGLAAATNEGEGEELLPEGLGPPSPARQPKPVLTVEPPSLSMRLEFGQPLQAALLLSNPHDRPICFRVQSTNPARHYVTPARASIPAQSALRVVVDVDPIVAPGPTCPEERQDMLRVQSMWLPDHAELFRGQRAVAQASRGAAESSGTDTGLDRSPGASPQLYSGGGGNGGGDSDSDGNGDESVHGSQSPTHKMRGKQAVRGILRLAHKLGVVLASEVSSEVDPTALFTVCAPSSVFRVHVLPSALTHDIGQVVDALKSSGARIDATAAVKIPCTLA